jgi:excisionase family DNA binding protein
MTATKRINGLEADRLYRVEDAAAILALKPSTIRKQITRRAITVVRPTGKRAVRIAASELARLQRDGECRRLEHAS